ncbi:MAG TPA: alpha/beta fold hydrolase [Bryobacteraceae bacterium]|nr:alpha/beta fold hydrolase [Bryobacteraceae bacterium]
MRFRFALCLVSLCLLADAPSPGRKYTTLERLDTAHLAAVHEAREKFAAERKRLPNLGLYNDYRAVMHVHAEDAPHTKGTRPEVLTAAKATGVQVVMWTDHNGPKPESWAGMRDGVLFIQGAEGDHLLSFPKPGADLRFLSHLEETPNATSAGFQGTEIYNRHTDAKDEKAFDDYFRAAMKNPEEWAKIAEKEKEYPDEVFAAEGDYLTAFLAFWDKELAKHPFTGIAANDSHKNQIYNGVTFDPYEVSFRNVSTHILARELTDQAIRDSLREGRVYVSHDWLCDPTGFSFAASNNNGVYDMGDHIPMLNNTRLVARLPLAAKIKLIHNGDVVGESTGSDFVYTPKEVGAYRLEAWLTVDGEERPWIYTNALWLEDPALTRLQRPSSDLAPNVEVHKDIAYALGKPEDAGKHNLDIYTPQGKKNFPVLIFIHGGSWRSGDRSNYPALANRFAKEGIGVVVPSYRLMPANPHPAQVDDATAAVSWTIAHVAEYGGDPKKIYLAGHSAGGHLAAYAGLNPKFWPNLKGVLPLSGVYDVRAIPGFKEDGEKASPMTHIRAGAPPFLVEYCQNDYPTLTVQARDFAAALKSAGDSVEVVYVPGENHISEIVNVYKDDDPIALAVLHFIQQHP